MIEKAGRVVRQLDSRPEFKLVVMENHEDSIAIRDGRVEKMLRASSLSLALNLYIDGRDGFFYTNNLTDEAVADFIRQAEATTILLQPDETRTLADPSRYYRGDGPDLHNCDPTIATADPQRKIALTRQVAEGKADTDSRIRSIQTRYSDRLHRAWYQTSNGFEGYEESSWCTLACLFTVEGEDGQHPIDGWGETRIYLDDMPTAGIADTALRRTLMKIGQRPAKSGRYRMILESPCAGNFMQPLLNAMGGHALQGRTSFLQDRLDQQVASPLLNVVDDPLIPGTRGASLFDYDGVATKRRELFTDGRLRMYFIDTPNSRKLNMPPTTQGIHHLITNQGTKTLDQLIGESDNAILVTDFNGGNCDPSTGNFSYGIEGFLIRNGIIVQPVSGMNITGNMLDTWQHLTDLGNDADPWETELIPSLVFEDVAFGGTA